MQGKKAKEFERPSVTTRIQSDKRPRHGLTRKVERGYSLPEGEQ